MNWEGALEQKRRVLIVDEQVSVREMLAMLLDRDGRFAVIAEAATGLEGLRLFRRHQPSLVITELNLPEMTGSELLLGIREENMAARRLVFSGTRNEGLVRSALGAAPHGFVHKTEPLLTMRQAVSAVTEGLTFFGKFATRKLEEMQRAEVAGERLTPKQRTVLQLIAEGLSTKGVADRLSLSPKTVEHYRTQLMQRLGIRDVASLTRYAMRCGLVAED